MIKILTYNIDCLPETIDLNDLPWILRPIAWIYKLFKNTTLIKINDNNISYNKLNEIKEYLIKSNADIIGVQEDFNYHNNIYPKELYKDSIHTGKIEIKNLKWFPYPRFKADGINLFTNIRIIPLFERIIKWNKSCGYIGHANDKLTTKGFRFYTLLIDNLYYIDLYIVHMDADFYISNLSNVKNDLETRKSQLEQIVNHIKNHNHKNPILIMGDTNSYDKYEWDKKNIQSNLIDKINFIPELTIKEAIPNNYRDCDKIFYINNVKCKYKLKLKECYLDISVNLSDHYPLIATFDII